jgi:acyl-CoA reductase-like NAD-dependent aldehyde dehydrogenase
MAEYGLFINGEWIYTDKKDQVVDKATGETVAKYSLAGEQEVAAAVTAAAAAFRAVKLEPYQRYEILRKASQLLIEQQEDLALLLSREVGKPVKEARGEVIRSAQTLLLSGEEAKTLAGEVVPVQGAPGNANRWALTLRVPVGVVCAITPFNFPLNLACHKIGPALAGGNTVVFKPASVTAGIGAALCRIFAEAGLPAGCLNMVLGSGSLVGEALARDERIAFYSFTGSVPVGKRLKNSVGFRRVSLELGANSANIVHDDADIKVAAETCARFAYANAGQVCISCQRVYVQRRVYEDFCRQAVAFTQTLKVGNPLDPATDIGPMISEEEARRTEEWVNEAVAAGARVLVGGKRSGAWFEPTILTDVRADMKVVCQEIFAPVFIVVPYDDIEEAIAQVNDSMYGLQAGVFTNSLALAKRCAEELEVGGVIINDGATFRTDLMPYGGVKFSGIGKEGPRYAVREMTEEKLVVFKF